MARVERFIVNTKRNTYHGCIGDPVLNTNLHVGDIVLFKTNSGYYHVSFVTDESANYHYTAFFFMGSYSYNLTSIESQVEIEKIIYSHKIVTKEMINELYEEFSIEERPIKKMTLSEVEKLLGFKVNIVPQEEE